MNYGDYGARILNFNIMRLKSKILLLLVGLSLSPLAWAQQLTGKPVATTNTSPTEATYLLGTGVTAPGALLYRGPIAGQFLAPMVPSARPVAKAASSAALQGGENPAPTPGASSLTCVQLAARVNEEISKSPKDVLSSVRRAMVDNDACACDIVKTAIKSSRADDELTGLIVEVAVKTQPSRFKEIVECAMLAKPTAKAQVRAALERVFGSKGSGKGGKVVVPAPSPVLFVREIPQIFFSPPPVSDNDRDATPTNPRHDSYRGR